MERRAERSRIPRPLPEARSIMLRYSCDQCGKDLGPEQHRYVVKIEVNAANDAVLTDADLADDPVETLSQLLQEHGAHADLSAYLPPERSSFRYDLCSNCHARFVRNPLSREPEKKFQFSKN